MDAALTITNALAAITLLWSIVGYLCWRAVSDIPKSWVWSLYVAAIAGPLVWGLVGLRGWSAGRRWALAKWGVAGYSCCGGAHHGECKGGHR